MLRKALILGMGFILAVSLLSISMITCFTYDAHADVEWRCTLKDPPHCTHTFYGNRPDMNTWDCDEVNHFHPHTPR